MIEPLAPLPVDFKLKDVVPSTRAPLPRVILPSLVRLNTGALELLINVTLPVFVTLIALRLPAELAVRESAVVCNGAAPEPIEPVPVESTTVAPRTFPDAVN